MKHTPILTAALGLLLALPGAARAADDAFAPVKLFADGMNSGDVAKASAAHVAGVSIIDEFGPHHWNSFAAWNCDFGLFAKTEDVSDFHMSLSAPSDKMADASYAYAVVPAVLTYKVKGKPTSEKGLFTFALADTKSGWRIASWAWSTL